MFLRRRIALVRREHGFALVMALGMMIVLGAVVLTAVTYATSNTTESTQSGNRNNAFTLAEAGINNAMAVLNQPSNNALDPNLLPSTTSCSTSLASSCSPGGNGYVVWGGTLDRAQAVWTVTATGYYRNPAKGGSGYLKRTLTAKVTVVPTYTQPLNNPVWNYLMSTGTGSTCDETLSNNVSGAARFYVAGNLCLNQNVALTQNAVIVRGKLTLANNAAVGANTNMSTRVETYVGGGCKYGTATTFDTPCPGDSDHVYSKMNGPNYVIGVNSVAPLFAVPATDYPTWYSNAIPGPAQSCTTSSGTPPTFDTNYPTRDNNVTSQDLTPSGASYTCRVGPGASTTLSGAITSTATTINVASAAGFPTTTFRIKVDDEWMTVTGGFGTTTWVVQRGVSGSTAAAHVDKSTVQWDGAATTLSSAISSTSATTIQVASAAGFPTTAFQIRIDNEYMTVTGGFGTTTWTVQRGINGSTPATHSSGAAVAWQNNSSGEISWNSSANTLTIHGTIFIDGSAKVTSGALIKYFGQATLYLSGTFYLNGKVCGGISGSNCDFNSWDPNASMFTIVTNSTGGQDPAGDGIYLTNGSSFQGSLYSSGAVEYGNNAYSDGPVVGSQIILANNVTTQAFPNITTLPVGQPGNPEVYAQPNPPQMFSG